MTTTTKPYVVCYRGVAHPWLCDQLGHFNTRHYMAAYDDAMQHFFAIIGYKKQDGYGWADVRHEIEYRAEIAPGALFHIDAALIRVGGKSITYHQRITLTDSNVVASTNKATTVLFDLEKRAAVTAPSIISDNAGQFTVPDDAL